MDAYDGKCAVSGCVASAVLEAAHITPLADAGATDPSNGLLLRADIHTLFDLRLISIDSRSRTLLVHQSLKGSEYWEMRGSPVSLPQRTHLLPSTEALDDHRRRSGL